jgi:hypothetical protein
LSEVAQQFSANAAGRAISAPQHRFDVDICARDRQMCVAEAVVVLGFRTAEQLAAATLTAEQELDSFGQAGLALAITRVDNYQWSVQL